MKLYNFLLFIHISITFSHASQSKQQSMLYGVGATTCGDYISYSQAESQEILYLSWVQGYISAYNEFSSLTELTDGKIAQEKNIKSLKLWLKKYCKENPLQRFGAAADALVATLIENRYK